MTFLFFRFLDPLIPKLHENSRKTFKKFNFGSCQLLGTEKLPTKMILPVCFQALLKFLSPLKHLNVIKNPMKASTKYSLSIFHNFDPLWAFGGIANPKRIPFKRMLQS